MKQDFLDISELVAHLHPYFSPADFLSCVQLNSTWNKTFIPFLWGSIDDSAQSWGEILLQITDPRPQPPPTAAINAATGGHHIRELKINQALVLEAASRKETCTSLHTLVLDLGQNAEGPGLEHLLPPPGPSVIVYPPDWGTAPALEPTISVGVFEDAPSSVFGGFGAAPADVLDAAAGGFGIAPAVASAATGASGAAPALKYPDPPQEPNVELSEPLFPGHLELADFRTTTLDERVTPESKMARLVRLHTSKSRWQGLWELRGDVQDWNTVFRYIASTVVWGIGDECLRQDVVLLLKDRCLSLETFRAFLYCFIDERYIRYMRYMRYMPGIRGKGPINQFLITHRHLREFDSIKNFIKVDEMLREPWTYMGLEWLTCRIAGLDRLTPMEEGTVARIMASGYSDGLSEEETGVVEKFNRCRAQQRGEYKSGSAEVYVGEDGEEYLRYDPPMFDTLELTLESGLSRLGALKDLEMFGFECLNHKIGKAEMAWMAKSWPKLNLMYGLNDERLYVIEHDKEREALREYFTKLQPNVVHDRAAGTIMMKVSSRAVIPQSRQQTQAQRIYQECSSAIGTDELKMPLGPGTSRTSEEEEVECILSGSTGGEGVCPSRSWDACYPLTVDEWSRTMNQREEVSNDVSKGYEMEQDVTDSFPYSDEYLPSGDNFGGAGHQVLLQSLQAEEEFEQGSGRVNSFCFGVYETDGSQGVAVWSPELDVPDLTIPLPDGSAEWIHESYFDDRTTSKGPSSGGSFEWGSTDRTGPVNGGEICGNQGWQDEYSSGSSSSASMWKRSIWKDIETSHQSFQNKQQQRRLCGNGEDGSVLDMQQKVDDDLFEAVTMRTVGLLGTSTSAKPTTPIPSTTSRATEFVSTTEQPRDWILEQLEGLASRFLYDLSLGERPVNELASRTRMDAVVYDQEVGVIRRRRGRASEAVVDRSRDDDVGATGLLEDETMERIAREEGEGEEGEEKMYTANSGKRRKAAAGSEAKGGTKRKRDEKSIKDMLYDTFDAINITKSSIPWPPPPSPSSSPFTQRAVRIIRATELIHENVSKDTIYSKRDMYYRDVMAFGSQTAVDGIVEDLACTFEVPRSSLNVVAGIRSVVFGSIRTLVKALGRQKSVAVDDNGGEDSGASEQLLWLQEEIANSPFSMTQTLSNSLMTKEHGEGEEEEEDDSLDSRFSQTSYNTLVPIPIRFSDIVEIEIHPRTRFVLVIEKEATLSNLISLGFCETHGPCILLTSKGFPDQVARQLLKALSEMILDKVYIRRFPSPPPGLGDSCNDGGSAKIKSSAEVLSPYQSAFQSPPLEIPLVALMDCDPHGIEIYLTYRCGSINSAYENANLAVPALKYLGQFPSDWDLFLNSRPIDALPDGKPPQWQEQDEENDEEREIMRLRARFKEMLIPLTAKDRTKLERLTTTHPYICQHARWRDQIGKMLEADAKTEIQSLHLLDYSCAGSGASVTDEGNKDEIGGGRNTRGAEEGGELAVSSSSALVLYLQRKLQDPESWL
ncbi:endodeoxyribonuclease [Mortierella hygrophila]|uniref:DNA topoisomerase (ATP-hydrolyzing) n=2 Tax=Mortierella hygrophila TaxID=979708 RepID=A0A9P6EZ34_9FUNG|nr:endodeoxyribonuclease [Mortierella hygrophila]